MDFIKGEPEIGTQRSPYFKGAYSLIGRFQEAGEIALGEWQVEGKKINVGMSRLHPGAWGLLPQGLPENCTESLCKVAV